jgi:ATP-dependent exoDNAse (exonuclease V) beta subunit
VYFTPQSLTRWLKDEGRYERFRRVITRWFMSPIRSEEDWEREIDELRAVLNIDELSSETAAFTEFDPSAAVGDDSEDSKPNCYICENGRVIEVGTIHSVKGETHDATLLLETKFRSRSDCKEMLPFMIDGSLDRPDYDPSSPQKKHSVLSQFMRKMYVACTRPRNLLCIAMHKKHVTGAQLEVLKANSWDIIEI